MNTELIDGEPACAEVRGPGADPAGPTTFVVPVRSPGLLRLIAEDWRSHRRDWTLPGFRAVAVHRFGQWRMRIGPKVLRAPFSLLYRFLYRRCRNVYGIELPYTVRLGRRVVFEHQGGIVIHGDSEIGDDTVIRQGVTLGIRDRSRLQDAPKLGRGVDVGAGAKILGGIHVEDGAVIGANAVVIRDVPAHAVVVGVPARIVRRGPRRERD